MDYYSKYIKYKSKFLKLKMELSKNSIDDMILNNDEVGEDIDMDGGDMGLPDVLPDSEEETNMEGGDMGLPDALSDSEDNLLSALPEFEQYLKGGADDIELTPTNTPLFITDLSEKKNDEKTPINTPVTTTNLSEVNTGKMEGGDVSPTSNEIFESISQANSKTE